MSDASDRIRALYAAGRFAEAVDYIRALCRQPDVKRGAEWRAIASAASNLSDLTTARLAALRWRTEDPEGFEPLMLAAGACAAARDESYTRNSIDLLVQRFPERGEAWLVAGAARGELGDFDRAIHELKRAHALNPELTSAWDAIIRLKTFARGDPDFDVAAGLPERSSALPTASRAAAHYAAAGAWRAAGDAPRAFRHYAEGAALRRSELTHAMTRVLGMMRNAVDSFEPDMFDRFRGEGAPDTGAIFLIGAARSGTALVEQILASHPRIYGAGESGVARLTTWPLSDLRPLYVGDVAKLAADGRKPWRGLGQNFATFSKELYRDRLYTVHRGLDLLPFAGALRLMLPFAKIIFVDRDPLEAAWSAFCVNYAARPWSFDFDDIAEWFAAYDATRQAWRERLGGETLDLSYEALIADPKAETRRLLKFIGVAHDPACDRFHETERLAPVESVRRIRSPIDAASLAPTGAYGALLDPLRAALERRGVAGRPRRLH